jgi:hypothetical protein
MSMIIPERIRSLSAADQAAFNGRFGLLLPGQIPSRRSVREAMAKTRAARKLGKVREVRKRTITGIQKSEGSSEVRDIPDGGPLLPLGNDFMRLPNLR